MNRIALRLSFIWLFVAVFAFGVQAQSGRRKDPPPPAAPIPTPTPEPTPVEIKKIEDKNNVGFVVAMDRGGALSNYPTNFYDIVQFGVAERLRSVSSAWVDVARDDLNRGQALKRAKEESTGYVVWLQLGTNAMSSSPPSQTYNDLEIEYTVFAPGTGKTATTGHGYPNANRKGPLVVTPPIATNNVIIREQLLKMAAEDVADRILKSLHVPTRK